MLIFILIVFLAIWLLGSHVGYNRWGYGGGVGVGGVLLLIFLVLLLLGYFGPIGIAPGRY